MHALVVSVTIEPGHDEEAQAQLESNVLPMVKQSPGVVSGYWMRSSDGQHGSSVVLFENEEAARAAADMVPNTPRPDFITFDSIEVREVVAHF
jgi:quinol monooxygenase YgiN